MKKWLFWLLFFLIHYTGLTFALTVDANFTSASTIPITAASYTAAGNTVNLTLSFAPARGTDLTVVENTGLGFIQGTFSNITQGKQVDISYNGINYRFVANYFGGSGNDFVLVWADRVSLGWGYRSLDPTSGRGVDSNIPVSVFGKGILTGKEVVAVSAALSHSLALCSDGTVVAWGENYYGQLGNNSVSYSSIPVQVNQAGVLKGKSVVAVSASSAGSLALCSDGSVAAWGINDGGQLGNNSTSTGFSSVPVLVSQSGVLSGKKVVAVSAGEGHSLALCSDGTVAAWGFNYLGQLGNNSTVRSMVPVLVNREGVLSGKTVVDVSAGPGYSLALCSDGTVAAWGENSSGQLGNNSTTGSSVPVLVSQSGVLSGKTVVAISAGTSHSLALCSDGTVAAWGANGSGQLGNSNTTGTSVPVLVSQSGVLNGKTVVGLAAGSMHSLVVASDGTIAAWGANADGRLGNNSMMDSSVPVRVANSGVLSGKIALAVSAGDKHSLALCSDGTLVSWGDNFYGQLGNDSSDFNSVPVLLNKVVPLSGKTVISVSAGAFQSLALYSDGTVAAWVDNDGNSPSLLSQTGALVGKTVVAVSAGRSHSLALCSDGTVAAWGGNSSGQLGNNSTGGSSVPVLVSQPGVLSGKTVVAVSAGGEHSLALYSDGTVAAWGANYSGQLGNNSLVGNSSVPVLVSRTGVLNGKTVTSVSAGLEHSLARCSDGTVAAWGENGYGQLGNNSNTSSRVPVLALSSGVVAVSAGGLHSLALHADGTVAAWGQNGLGQLGCSNTTDSSVPVLVSQSGVLSGKRVVAVSAGEVNSLALCSDGTVASWGNLFDGFYLSPVLVRRTGGAEVVVNNISAGSINSMASGWSAFPVGLSSISLSSGNLYPAFEEVLEKKYIAYVSGFTENVSVTPTLINSTSSVKVNGTIVASGAPSGPISLSVGSNMIAVEVVAQDGVTSKTYTVEVIRAAASNVTMLSNLSLSVGDLSPAFDPATASYTASVLNSTASVTVAASVSDSTATVKVNGAVVSVGSSSAAIPLAVGSTTISVVVTAQDGVTTRTYLVVVTRAASKVATLSDLYLSSGFLTPTFTSDRTSYSASVSNSTASVTVAASVTDSTATVKVNGAVVTVGSSSAAIPLAVGNTTISVVVTAQDGMTTKTYTLAVTRSASTYGSSGAVVKLGNTNDLNLITSWSGGIVPGALDVALWDSTVTGANSTILGSNLSLGGLSVTSPGGAVTIGAGSTLTLGTSGINLSTATQNLSISSGLTLANGGQSWNVASGRTLALSTGAFSRSAGTSLNLPGSGSVTSTMMGLANTNNILGPWATVGTGSSTRFATLSTGSIVGFTGGTASGFNWASGNNNTFNYDVAATLGVTPIGLARQANTVRYTGAAGTQNYGSNNTTTVTLNGLLNVGTGTLTVSELGGTAQGQFAIGTNNGNELVLGAANADITVKIPIINTGANAGSLLVTGQGMVTIDSAGGVSTYTGATTVTSGTLSVRGAGNINTTSGITINGSGAKYLHTSSVASTRNITLTRGTLDGTGTLGSVTVADDSAAVVTHGNGSASALTFGALTFNGDATVNLNVSTGAGLKVTGALATAANGQVVLNVPTLLLPNGLVNLINFGSFTGNPSDFTANFTGLGARQIAGAVQLNGSNIAVNISGENLVWTGAGSDLWQTAATGDDTGPNNWARKTVQSATNFWAADSVEFNDTYDLGSGSVAVTQSQVAIGAALSPAATLFNNSAIDYQISGAAIAAGTLVKSGTGSVTLLNANTYAGATTINQGKLILGNGTTDGSIASTASVTNNGILEYNLALPQTSAYPISGTGSLTKTGTGILSLSGANTYSGGTSLSSGALSLIGTGTLGSGPITLAAGTTLNVNANLVVASTVSGSGAIVNTESFINNGDFSGFNGSFTHSSSTVSVAFNTATSTSQNAAYIIAAPQGRAQGMISAGNGDYTLKLGSLSGVADSLFRGGLTATGTTNLEIGNLGTNTEFAGSINDGTTKVLSLTKVGSGTLTLSGASNYSGATLVNAGTLNLTGSLTALSSVTVSSGATLSGSGSVTGTVTSSGIIAPGVGAGTLSTGAATLSGTLAIEIDGATGDKLVSSGAINLSGVALTVNLLSGGFSQPSYVIAEGTSITGTFASVPSGYAVNIVSAGAGQQAVLTTSGGYSSWASTNIGGDAANLDTDKDGVANGVEYFMNASAGFTANPGIVSGTITWPNGGNIPASAYGTQFVVQTSTGLSTWIDVPVENLTTNTNGPSGSLTYTLPTSPGPWFVRLKVTPN
jgi:autotransporter-associated beta strand protein